MPFVSSSLRRAFLLLDGMFRFRCHFYISSKVKVRLIDLPGPAPPFRLELSRAGTSLQGSVNFHRGHSLFHPFSIRALSQPFYFEARAWVTSLLFGSPPDWLTRFPYVMPSSQSEA